VDITVRVWCAAADYWDVKFALTKTVKEAFDRGGISIPYPHTVEIKKAG
jgi:small conductance mechanosensitive channel